MGEVRGNAGKGEGREEMCVIKSVLGPHTSIHFPTSTPFPSPHPFPTRLHTSPLTPYTLPHPPHTSFLTVPPPTPQHISLHLPHTPHISSHSSPDLPLHPNTLPYSLHALSPHLTPCFDYVAKLPCDDVTLMKLTRKAR